MTAESEVEALTHNGDLHPMSADECLALLATVPVGRVALSVDGLPAVLPVNFVLYGNRIVFGTVPGSKLNAAAARRVVAFEADSYDPRGRWGWSVMAQGEASELTAPDDLAEIGTNPPRPWAFPGGAAGRYVGIRIENVTGRRFGMFAQLMDAGVLRP